MPPWQTEFTCKRCGHPYDASNGVVGYGHDKCFDVRRDPEGFAWFPGQVEQLRTRLDEVGVYTVTRTQAFAPREAFKKAFPGKG
jgi:hypothetical protein